MCPLICSITNHGGEFANIIMQRVKHSFGENVYKHYKTSLKCTPLTFDFFFLSFFFFSAEYLHYNVNICRGEKIILSEHGLTVELSQLGVFFARINIPLTVNLRKKCIMLTLIICCIKV